MKKAEKEKFIAEHFQEIRQLSSQLIAKHKQIDELDLKSTNALDELETLNKEIKVLTKEYFTYAKYCKNPPVPKPPKKTK